MPPASAVIRELNPDQHRTLHLLRRLLVGLSEDQPSLDLEPAIKTVDDLMLHRPVDDGDAHVLELEARIAELETALAVIRTGVRLADGEIS